MASLPEVLIEKIFNYAFYPHEMPFCNTCRYNRVVENLPRLEMNHDPYRIFHWYYDYYPNYNYFKIRQQCLTGFGKPFLHDELRIMTNLDTKPYIIFSYILKRLRNKPAVEIREITNNKVTDNYEDGQLETEYKSYIEEKKPICKDFLFEDDY